MFPKIPLFLIIGLVVLLIAGLVVAVIIAKRGSARIVAKSPLLSPPEQQLYRLLVQTLPDHVVLAQVAFSQMLQATGGSSDENFANRGRFKQKVADFVVCSKDFKMVAVIELDDSTHSKEKDARRDAMLAEAGLRTVRWRAGRLPDATEVKKAVLASG